MLAAAALLGGPALAAGQTPPVAELTPLGKLLLEEVVKRTPATAGAPEAFATCAFPGGLCGVVSRDGKVVVAPQFDWVDDFVEERALVRLRGLYGFIDTSGRVIAEPKYELAGRFQRGYAQVVLGDKMGLIDREGKFVFEPAYGYIGVFGAETFKASTGREVCQDIKDISIDGISLGFLLGECAIDLSSIDVRRLAGDDTSGAIMTITSFGNLWPPIIAPAGKIDILDGSGRQLNRVDLLKLGELGSFDRSAVAKTETGWGIIRADGTWAIEPNLEGIGILADGMAPAKRNGKWGYIDKDGRWIVAERFDSARPFSKGRSFAAAGIGKRYGLIDRSGSWVFEPAFDKLWYPSFPSRKDTWVAEIDGKHGLLDEATRRPLLFDAKLDRAPEVCHDGRILGTVNQIERLFTPEGKPLLPPDGDIAGVGRPFMPSPGCEAPYPVKSAGKYGLVDAQMLWLVRPELDEIGRFLKGLAQARRNGKMGVLRQDGTWAMQPRFDDLRAVGGDLYAAAEGGKWGLAKTDGTWIVVPRFDDLRAAGSELYAATQGGKWGLIKIDGTWAIEPKLDAIRLVPGLSRALVKRDGMAGMIDLKTERWLIGPVPGEVCSVWSSPSVVIAEAGGKRALYDVHTGAQLIPPRYERIGWPFQNGLVRVLENGKFGFADLEGRLVIPFVSDEQTIFQQGIAWIKTGAKWCPIDRRGDPIPNLACRDKGPGIDFAPPHVCRVDKTGAW